MKDRHGYATEVVDVCEPGQNWGWKGCLFLLRIGKPVLGE